MAKKRKNVNIKKIDGTKLRIELQAESANKTHQIMYKEPSHRRQLSRIDRLEPLFVPLPGSPLCNLRGINTLSDETTLYIDIITNEMKLILTLQISRF